MQGLRATLEIWSRPGFPGGQAGPEGQGCQQKGTTGRRPSLPPFLHVVNKLNKQQVFAEYILNY